VGFLEEHRSIVSSANGEIEDLTLVPKSLTRFFLRRLRDPIRVPKIREIYHRVPTNWENRVPRIRETGYL